MFANRVLPGAALVRALPRHVGRLARVTEGGALRDVAPTLLAMMGLAQPEEMTGKSLVTLEPVAA